MKPLTLFVVAGSVLTLAAASVEVQAQGRGGAAGQAQTGAPPAPIVRTASITGQVVDADTGSPVSGAIVRLQSRVLAAAAGGRGAGPAPFLMPGMPAPTPGTEIIVADRDGRFGFTQLPKGATQLTATAAGYLDRAPSGAPARPIQLADDEKLSDVKLRVVKGASVSGVILDEAGEPAVGVTVRAMRRESPQGVPRYTMVTGSGGPLSSTDDRGVYRIDGLPPGVVYVVVPQSQTIVPASDLDRDGSAMPISGAMMEALTGGAQTSFMPPAIQIGDQAWRPSMGVMTSLVPPPPQNGRLAAYQTTFYPSATQLSQAAAITLRSGEERVGVDLQIRPTAIGRVAGVLQGPSGPAGGVMIRLVPAPGRAEDDTLAVGTATTGPDGSFAFLGVPSGQYVAKAQQNPRGGMPNFGPEALANVPPELIEQMRARVASAPDALFTQSEVSVGDRDVTGLTLMLRVGAKVAGSIVFDGVTPPSAQQIQNVQVAITRQGGSGAAQIKMAADHTFKSTSFAAGTYTVSAAGVAGPWMLRSVTVGGRDVLAHGLEIADEDVGPVVVTFTDRLSSLSGVAHQDANGPMPNSSVMLVSANFRSLIAEGSPPRVQLAAVQANGSFMIGRLMPGEYIVVALLDDLVPIDRDAAFFEAMERDGVRVTVNEGEAKSQDLRLVRSIR